MQESLDKLGSLLFQKKSLEECSLVEVKELAQQYPYFATAQLLYSRKLKQENHADFNIQFEKTTLNINNPIWLNYLINKKAEAEIISESVEVKNEPLNVNFEHYRNDEEVVDNSKPVFHQPDSHQKFPEFKMPSAEASGSEETTLTFDPYHTVDYFASQGIKPQTDEKPTDRFGQQLKSFTDWLKTLRQVQPIENSELTIDINEEKVVELADQSVKDNNVLTEAMAEVWIKQGMPEKAMDVYDKLSLLNPSKSGYFASLKENLKNK